MTNISNSTNCNTNNNFLVEMTDNNDDMLNFIFEAGSNTITPDQITQLFNNIEKYTASGKMPIAGNNTSSVGIMGKIGNAVTSAKNNVQRVMSGGPAT